MGERERERDGAYDVSSTIESQRRRTLVRVLLVRVLERRKESRRDEGRVCPRGQTYVAPRRVLPSSLGRKYARRLRLRSAWPRLMNGRFAMIGALGIMGGEVLGAYKDVTWYEAGAKGYDIPILPLVAVQAVVMGFLETKRYQGFKNTGLSGGLIDDQPFDPAKLLTEKSKLQEVKNARLAMVAMFGFAGQAACTPGVGPIQNLTDHLANPFGCNIITNVLTIQDHLADPGFAKGVAAVAEAAAEAAAEAGAVVEAAAQ